MNLKKVFTNLDGTKGDKDFGMGKALANIIITSKNKKLDHFKKLELARKAYACEKIDFDKSDVSVFKEMVDECEVYSSLILGQVMEELINTK